MTITKDVLSGSPGGLGRAIKIAAVASPGTLIHTGPTNPAQLHEVYLYAYNSDTVTREIIVQWAGTTSPDDDIAVTIPPRQGVRFTVSGLPLKGNASALVVRAYCASAANTVMIHGYIHIIS